MGMFNGYGMGAGGWLLMVAFWALIIGLVVFAIVRVFPAHREPQPSTGREEQPVEILRRRLANGEIDTETFEQLSAKVAAGSPAGKR